MATPNLSRSAIALFIAVSIHAVHAQTDQEDIPKPIGWEEMSAERQSEYLKLRMDYSEALADMTLSDDERAAMSEAERNAFQSARREVHSEFKKALVDAGFDLAPIYRSDLPSTVKKAVKNGNKTLARTEKIAASATGSIIYDDGVVGTIFGGGAIIGNRFDTFSGGNPVGSNGTITAVQGVLQPGPANTNGSGLVVIEGPQTAGGGAAALFNTAFSGLTDTVETVSITGLNVNYTGSSFFVLFGDFAQSYVPAFGTGSANGQGFHGVVGYTGGMFPSITSTFDFGNLRNGLVRASGNILTPIPVELMEIEVESE